MSGRFATLQAIRAAAPDWPLQGHNSPQGFRRPVRGSFGGAGYLDDAPKSARPSSGWGRPRSIRGQAVSFDWQKFFTTQIEECRELERQAVNVEDRAFWQQTGRRWEEQLRIMQTQAQQYVLPARAENKEAVRGRPLLTSRAARGVRGWGSRSAWPDSTGRLLRTQLAVGLFPLSFGVGVIRGRSGKHPKLSISVADTKATR